jgi:feruloyl esterase
METSRSPVSKEDISHLWTFGRRTCGGTVPPPRSGRHRRARAIPPQDSIDYFESVQSATGTTNNFYRLFMVPGMSHCGGGIGANVFGNGLAVPDTDAAPDVVMALDQWVVHDVAPDQIIATGFIDGNPAKDVVMTRPLRPYPQEAQYKGAGNTNSAATFTCQTPARNATK